MTFLKIHAIVFALNEEIFIDNQLRTLYPYCDGISVLTQYDRDWYGKSVKPDETLLRVANFPDPDGKIHLVLRRWRDQAAGYNCEIQAVACNPAKRVLSHGTPTSEIQRFHQVPDYFWIVDADEFYDPKTIPAMLDFLESKRPRGMRVHGYNYVKTWNRRVPMTHVKFCQFGFVDPSIRFTSIRHVSWNESRLQKLLNNLHLPDFSASLFGFIECPTRIAVFHHGCWLGDRERLAAKGSKSAHTWINRPDYADTIAGIKYERVSHSELPSSISDGVWPATYFD